MTLPSNITNIPSGTFQACRKLESIIIPDSVKSIDDDAFFVCNNLKSVVIPNGVVSIGSYAFYDTSLQSIVIPDSVTSIGEFAFSFTPLKSIVIPDSVTSISYCAFSLCKNLTSVTIPSGVTTIEDRAFFGFTNLKEITIPESVTSIGDYAIGSYRQDKYLRYNSKFIVKGCCGSAAQVFANKHKLTFIELNRPASIRFTDGTSKYVNVYGGPVALETVMTASAEGYEPISTLKWKSSSAKIAKIDANGVLTPVKEGTVTITVTTSNGKKAALKVTIVDNRQPGA